MPRARLPQDDRQTAAAYESQGSGCLSPYLLPPLAVLVVSVLLAIFAMNTPVQAIRLVPPSTAAVQAADLPAEATRTPFQPEVLFLRPASPTAPPRLVPDPVAESAPAGASQTQAAPPPDAPLLGRQAGLAPLFRPEVLHWGDSILKWSAAAGVDPNLVATVMQIESCGDPRAISRSGAIGLFQVMPYHFYLLDDAYDPDTNAARGLDYLRRSLETAGGDSRLALAGYNGGIGVIDRGEWTWPAETIRYVYWGDGIYTDATRNSGESPRLTEWYTTAGASLCRQASQRLGLGE
jgi:soluble lytic murein transglycosylase-like protein